MVMSGSVHFFKENKGDPTSSAFYPPSPSLHSKTPNKIKFFLFGEFVVLFLFVFGFHGQIKPTNVGKCELSVFLDGRIVLKI